MKVFLADIGLILMVAAVWGLLLVVICRFFAASADHDQEGEALREDHKRRKGQRKWTPQTTWDVTDDKPHRATRRKEGGK